MVWIPSFDFILYLPFSFNYIFIVFLCFLFFFLFFVF